MPTIAQSVGFYHVSDGVTIEPPAKMALILVGATVDKTRTLVSTDGKMTQFATAQNGGVTIGLFYRIADGTETQLLFHSSDGDQVHGRAFVVDHVDCRHPFQHVDAAASTANNTYFTMEPGAPLAADGLAFAFIAGDTYYHWDTDSMMYMDKDFEAFVEQTSIGGSDAGIAVGMATLTAGQRPATTFSYRGTADEMAGAIVVLRGRTACDTTLVLTASGDNGVATGTVARIARRMVDDGTHGILGLGDLAYDNGTWQEVQDRLLPPVLFGRFLTGNFGTNRLWGALGNHDYAQGTDASVLDGTWFHDAVSGEGAFRNLPVNEAGHSRWYTLDYGTAVVLVMDSQRASDDYVAQKVWFDAAVAANAHKFRIVITHHAPYSEGSHGDTASLSDALWDWGRVHLVLSGHDHNAQHIAAFGTHFVVAGHGGRGRYAITATKPETVYADSNHFGYARLGVDGNTMTVSLINEGLSPVDGADVVHSFTVELL